MLTFLALAPFLLRAPDEFADELARLASPRAEERAAAERWLQAHLVFERYPAVAEAALAGDAEVRGRIARVLGAESRHLSLALALGIEADERLATLGRDAVRSSVARSEPRLTEPAAREGLELLLRRAASASAPRILHLEADRTLAEMLEDLDLSGELPLGLTLDANAAAKTFRRPTPLPDGPWNEVLWRFRELGVELECHGLERARVAVAPVGAFLHVTTDSGPPRTGVDLVTDWLLTLARPKDEEARLRAARNLASAGFTPALEWMEALAQSGDRAARDGLLRAAARGRVATVLASPAVLEPLLAEAETAAGRRSAVVLAALSRVGCLDPSGTPLVARLLEGFESRSPRARWARLHVLEHNGCASAELEGAARALLADPSAPAALALQALFVLGVQPGAPGRGAPRIASLGELFALDLSPEDGDRLGRALTLFGIPPPFSAPRDVPSTWSPSARERLLAAFLWAHAPEPAAAHCEAFLGGATEGLLARGEALADALQPWVERGEGAFVDGVLRRAAQRSPASGAFERVRLLLGVVPAAEVPTVLARGFSLGGKDPDLALLGALGGYPASIAAQGPARETLRGLLATALQENRKVETCRGLLPALERAIQGCFSAGRDQEGEALTNTVLSLLRRNEKAPLAHSLERANWPRAARVPTLDLGRLLLRHEVPPSL